MDGADDQRTEPHHRTIRRPRAVEDNGKYVITGNVLAGGNGYVTDFGMRIQNPTEFEAGTTADLPGGGAR